MDTVIMECRSTPIKKGRNFYFKVFLPLEILLTYKTGVGVEYLKYSWISFRPRQCGIELIKEVFLLNY